jgi:hypothetical protein
LIQSEFPFERSNVDLKDKWRNLEKHGHVKDMVSRPGDGRVHLAIHPGKRKLYSRWSTAEEQALLAGLEK